LRAKGIASRGENVKAAIVPSANSSWEVKEVKMPEPGENQVLIKIRASGMCYTDVHQTHGELPRR
jgi:alcohol dehydrogenase